MRCSLSTMGLLERLSALIRPPDRGADGDQTVEAPEQRSRYSGEEAELRETLEADPNDAIAFSRLAEIVRRHAHATAPVDPLIADSETVERDASADVAVWALAEELAGNQRAWYPLIELGRLSLADDHEGAVRRLATACEREESGRALAEGVRALREAGKPADGLGLGVAYWVPQDHIAEAARQIVLAAVDAGRPADARRHLRDYAEVAGDDESRHLVAELEPAVAASEAASGV